MNTDLSEQAKNALQNLTGSLWAFSALSMLVETGAFTVLSEKTTVSRLKTITCLPEMVLIQSINLLVETGFLIFDGDKIGFSRGFDEFIKKSGIEKTSSQIQVAFGLASEFIKSSRQKNLKAGWHYTDEYILQAQGTHSEYIVTDCIPQDIRLQNLLKNPQVFFLDIGAGVGKISLRLCQIYDNVKVVALEPADVPFTLALKNIQDSKYADRIDLRKIYLEALLDKDLYDIIWFPHVFFSDDVFYTGLAKVWSALKSGGILITSAICSDRKNQALLVRQLINSLYGGLRTGDALTTALKAAGFQDIKKFAEISGYRTITAVKSYP